MRKSRIKRQRIIKGFTVTLLHQNNVFYTYISKLTLQTEHGKNCFYILHMPLDMQRECNHLAVPPTCHTPTTALAIRMSNITKGSTKAVTCSSYTSDSSNQANIWK
jgi:hypothetical protein